MTSSEPIRLRKRKLKDGRYTLYLDIYLKGERSYEYLHLYLIPETSRSDKENNKKTLALAEAVRAKRVVELQNGRFGFENKTPASEILFFDYYKAMCEKRKGVESRGNWGNWLSCLKHLEIYEKNQRITFDKITPKWVEGFKEYLDKRAVCWGANYVKCKKDKPLSQNSKASYFAKLRACLFQALDDGIIEKHPGRGIENFSARDAERMYLTIEELERLVATPCLNEAVRTAFLFSCLTGLRRSDIQKMTWGEVYQQGEYTRIIFKQKKTKGQEYLDISPQAVKLMGKRGKSDELVFRDFLTAGQTNRIIQLWVTKAGIDKDITFHCGRHTFAVMMLDLGTDIYTVSKLLGHREIGTTQIYAKVLDKNKQAAVSNIPDIFNPKKPKAKKKGRRKNKQ